MATKPGVTPEPLEWPPTLNDEFDIAAHIERTSTSNVDLGLIEDHFFDCQATLKRVNIRDIRPGEENANVPDRKKAARYAKLDLATMPPIVIEDGTIVDGHHRYRDAVAKGAEFLWCYVVDEKPSAELVSTGPRIKP